MATIGKVVINLEAQSAAVTVGVEKSKKSLDDAGKSAHKAGEEVSWYHKQLEALKSGAGRGSTLEETMKLLRGGGVVMGINEIGERLAHVSEEAVKLRKEFQEGQIDAAGIAAKLGESLPIIGGFVKAGQGFRELLLGEQADIDAINEATKRQGERIENVNKMLEHQVEVMRDLKDEREKTQDKVQGLQYSGDKAKAFEVYVDFKDHNRTLDKTLSDAEKQIRQHLQSEVGSLQKDLAATKTKAAEADAYLGSWKASMLEKEYRDKYQKDADDLHAKISELQAKINSLNDPKADNKYTQQIKALEKQGTQNHVANLAELLAGQLKVVTEAATKKAEESAKKTAEEMERAKEAVTKMREEASGLTESQKQLAEIEKLAHGDKGIIAQAKAAQAAADKQKEQSDYLKKEREEAKQAIEDSLTPLQKYQETLERNNELAEDGLLTAQQLAQANKKAADELEKQFHEDKHAKAETRRGDLTAPVDRYGKASAADQAKAQAAEQLESQKKAEWYLQQIWLKSVAPDDTSGDTDLDFA